MHILRTRFKRDIVCEFLPPARTSKKVLILCYGMPGVQKDKATMEFWSKKGFWVFFPRYRGTWESGGEFLKNSPEQDILDVIGEIPKGFTDLWSGKNYRLPSTGCELSVLGASFGGTAAVLASRDRRVRKAVALSPVIDWRVETPDEPMDKLAEYIPRAFGGCYRFSKKNWGRLSRGEFFNPADETATIDGKKLLIVHAKDDLVATYPPARMFARRTGAELMTFTRNGGPLRLRSGEASHFGLAKSTEPHIYKHIKKFFSS